MNPEERRNKILSILKESRSKVSLKDLVKILGISQSALYKDINVLENQRLVKRKYGKLEISKSEEKSHNFFLNLHKNAAKKRAIAKAAITLINNNETIFLDGSTTTFFLCEELKKSNLENITLITNSIFIPQEMIMHENINMICVGGMVNRFIGTSDGDIWELLIKNNLYANKFIFSCYSMSTDVGVLDPIQADASMKAMFASKSQRTICLLDSSKFYLYSTFNWLSLDKIDVIITDSGTDKEIIDKLTLKGIEVLISE